MNINKSDKFQRAQTVQKKKNLTLKLSKSAFDRLINYKSFDEKMLENVEKKMEKRAKQKLASEEMTKDWSDTIKNIQERRRKELLSRRKKVEEEKVKYIKELAVQNALERNKIVEQSKKLLMNKKPEIRMLNKALFESECYKELYAQLELKKNQKELDKQEKKEIYEKIKKDSENYLKEENKKLEERLKKMQIYGEQLKNQIEESSRMLKNKELDELNADKKDLTNMIQELKLIEQCQAEQIRKSKQELKKIFIDSLEQKKKLMEKIKRDDDIQNKMIEAYVKAKDEVDDLAKKKFAERRKENIKRTELIAKKCATIFKVNNDDDEMRLQQALEEQTKLQEEKLKAQREHFEKMRNDLLKNHYEYEQLKKVTAEEKKNLTSWEAFQRYKRNEYDKQLEQKKLEAEIKAKNQLAEDLKKQMVENELKRKEEQKLMDNSQFIKESLEKTNKRVLEYGQELLKDQSRPLFPIIKVIETFKRENNLLPPINYEQNTKKKRLSKPIPQTPPEISNIIFG